MQYLTLLILTLFTQLALAGQLTTTRDWAYVSHKASLDHSPIIVVFSAETCGYCARLKQEVIDPMVRQPPAGQHPLIREFDVNAGGKVIDFNGERIRSRQFRRRYNIFATPTLVVLAPDGHILSDPIVGYNSKQAYRELLQATLNSSAAALK